MLDDYVQGADTTAAAQFGPRTLDAVRARSACCPATRRTRSAWWTRSGRRRTRSARCSTRSSMLRADSRARRFAGRFGRGAPRGGLKVFGVETFRRATTRFQPAQAGPVDENYRLGPGDVLVLILTGDVERSHTLEVTREGFVVIPQVGQVYVANLTLGRAPGSALRPARPGVLRRAARRERHAPGSSSRSAGSGTSRSTSRATWCAPAPTRSRAPARCSPRSTPRAARRPTAPSGGSRSGAAERWSTASTSTTTCSAGRTRPTSGSRPATWSSCRCTAASPRSPARCCARRSTSCCPNETLRDAIAFAGGLRPLRGRRPGSRSTGSCRRLARRRAAARGSSSRSAPTSSAAAWRPRVPMAPGDSVTVHPVADRAARLRHRAGQRLGRGSGRLHAGHEAERRHPARRAAPSPTCTSAASWSPGCARTRAMIQLRSAFADSTGARHATTWRCEDQDEIRIFSRTDVPPRAATWPIVGAVRRPGRVAYPRGHDAPRRRAPGRRPDRRTRGCGGRDRAARPTDRPAGALAETVRVPLDSSYRRRAGRPCRPPAAGARSRPMRRSSPTTTCWCSGRAAGPCSARVVVTGRSSRPGRYSLRSQDRAGGRPASSAPVASPTEAYPGRHPVLSLATPGTADRQRPRLRRWQRPRRRRPAADATPCRGAARAGRDRPAARAQGSQVPRQHHPGRRRLDPHPRVRSRS